LTRDGQDQQVEDPHLGELVTASPEFLPDRSHCRDVAVQVAFVAADQHQRPLPERSLGSGVVAGQVLLDDAVAPTGVPRRRVADIGETSAISGSSYSRSTKPLA
jgi:hypothetical protein